MRLGLLLVAGGAGGAPSRLPVVVRTYVRSHRSVLHPLAETELSVLKQARCDVRNRSRSEQVVNWCIDVRIGTSALQIAYYRIPIQVQSDNTSSDSRASFVLLRSLLHNSSQKILSYQCVKVEIR